VKPAFVKRAEDDQLAENMSKIRYKIAVMSGKGGVGKSLVTANMAMAFAMKGYKVGLLDADIHGPSIPKMLGLERRAPTIQDEKIFPVIGPLNMKVMSMAFLLPSEETPVVWRGPLKAKAIREFLSKTLWGELDYLLVDLPPGTGDEPLSIVQLIPNLSGSVIVTIPSEVSQKVVKKAVTFCRELKVPVLGIIENMSYYKCPKCGFVANIFGAGGGERISKEMGVRFLGKIPIDPRISEASDKGIPFVVEYPDCEATKSFIEIVETIRSILSGHAENISK